MKYIDLHVRYKLTPEFQVVLDNEEKQIVFEQAALAWATKADCFDDKFASKEIIDIKFSDEIQS